MLPMNNRIEKDGDLISLLETDGGALFEKLDDGLFCVQCFRSDGSSVAFWFKGSVSYHERTPPGFMENLVVPVPELAERRVV